MITFKQYLAEARMAPLYHATPIGNLGSILNKGFIPYTYQVKYHGRGQASQGLHGVSFARSMKNSDWYMQKEYGLHSAYVTFEIDQQRLNQNHKILPFDYFGTNILMKQTANKQLSNFDIDLKHRRKEAEEFVPVKRKWDNKLDTYVGSVPAKYIVAVHYFTHDNDYILPFIKKYQNIRWVKRKG